MVTAIVAPPKTVFQKELKAPFYKLRFIGGVQGSSSYLGNTYRNGEFLSNVEKNDILYAKKDTAFRLLTEHPSAFINLGKGDDSDLDKIQAEREAFLEKQQSDVLGDIGEDKIVEAETETVEVIAASTGQIEEYLARNKIKLPANVKTRVEIEKFLKDKDITQIDIV